MGAPRSTRRRDARRRRLAARSDLLIEDASAHGPPYVDFLCGIHRSIQQRIAGGPGATKLIAVNPA